MTNRPEFVTLLKLGLRTLKAFQDPKQQKYLQGKILCNKTKAGLITVICLKQGNNDFRTSGTLGVVLPHLPVGEKFVRFCPAWPV